MKLTDEQKVLRFLAQGEEWYFPFRPISKATKLSRKRVRVVIRALARKGLTEYAKGLWSEYPGGPAGSGYRITSAGRKALAMRAGERPAPRGE